VPTFGKRDFHRRREDPYPRRVGGIFRRKHEDSFGIAEFSGDLLHLCIGQSARIRDHRKLVSGKPFIGENIDGDIGDAVHGLLASVPVETSQGDKAARKSREAHSCHRDNCAWRSRKCSVAMTTKKTRPQTRTGSSPLPGNFNQAAFSNSFFQPPVAARLHILARWVKAR
jgi:hypothetical protein